MTDREERWCNTEVQQKKESKLEHILKDQIHKQKDLLMYNQGLYKVSKNVYVPWIWVH